MHGRWALARTDCLNAPSAALRACVRGMACTHHDHHTQTLCAGARTPTTPPTHTQHALTRPAPRRAWRVDDGQVGAVLVLNAHHDLAAPKLLLLLEPLVLLVDVLLHGTVRAQVAGAERGRRSASTRRGLPSATV